MFDQVKSVVRVSKEVQRKRDELAKASADIFSQWSAARQAERDFVKMNTPSGVAYNLLNEIVDEFYIGYART